MTSPQSRRMSAAESVANVAIGYGIALLTQFVVFGALQIPVSLGQNLWIGAVFTAVSLVRSYAMRRIFNRL
jgi:hypothetical protein